MRALDATPASAAAFGLAAFEPSFTQQYPGGPKTFYGMLLVVSLVLVLVLAVGLTVKQACARQRWLTTVTSDALAQFGFAEPGASGDAAEAEESRGVELTEFRVSQMLHGGGGGTGGVGLPESGLVRGSTVRHPDSH